MGLPSLAAGAFLGLAFLVYGFVFANGLCCADDSAIAVAAKNVAFGVGYATSVPFDGGTGLRFFDPMLSTGPTLVLPAALLTALFGNLPWVPGFATATECLLLLAALFLLARRGAKTTGAAAFALLFTMLIYSLTAGGYFEHWHALIGEMPAALFSVAGAAVLALDPDRRGNVVAAGLLFGLAFLTKMLALLGFAPLCLWLAWRAAWSKARRPRRVQDLLLAGAAFLAPFLLFEIFKLLSLGIDGYAAYLKDFRRFFQDQGNAASVRGLADLVAAAWDKCLANARTMDERFGFSVFALAGAGLIAWGTLHFFARPGFGRRLCGLGLAAGAVHLAWWLFLSIGWPRYALIGLVLYFAGLACLVFADRRLVSGGLALLLLALFLNRPEALAYPVRYVLETGYAPVPRVQNLLRTAAFLESKSADRPFVGGWWATVGDLEYVLPTVGNFVAVHRVAPEDFDRELLLARNTTWVPFLPTAEFSEWERRCDEVLFSAPPYLVTRCPKRNK